MRSALSVLCLLLCGIVACSEDNGTNDHQEQKEDVEFRVAGRRTVQVWTHEELTITATAKSGQTPSLHAIGTVTNGRFADKGNGSCVIDFCPTKSQVGKCSLVVVAQTSDKIDSMTLRLTVVDSSELRVPILQVAVGNTWIYQSERHRLDTDTVRITSCTPIVGGYKAAVSHARSVPMLADSVLVLRDQIWSMTQGIQFAIPPSVPEEVTVQTSGGCYLVDIQRRVDWVADPLVVPAGTFRGCFKYTSILEHNCDGGGGDTIVEEIYVKPGIGIVKIAQIRSSECDHGCSSRWELLGWHFE